MSEFSKLNGYDVKDKKAIRYYDNIVSMKDDNTLKVGMYVKTKGYYSAGDGGQSEYIIKSSSDKYYETLNNELVAELQNNKINVLQVGLKGDGILDSTNILNTLIDSNKTIFFPKGTYNFGNVSLSNKSNIKIYGDNAILINNSSFNLTDCENVEINNLSFSESNRTPLVFTDCINANIHDNNFLNNEVSCIRLIRTTGKQSKNYKILNNTFKHVSATNVWGGAIYVDGQGKLNPEDTEETLPIENIIVSNNYFDEVGTGGVNFGGVKNAIVNSNIFKNSYGSQNMLMTCTRESTDLVISNNTFSGCGWECCILNHCNKANILGNYFEDFAYGITLENNTNNVDISNNVFNGMKNDRTHTGEGMQQNTFGILLKESNSINITSNNIDDCSSNIFCDKDLSTITINGNNLTNAKYGINYGGTNGSNSDLNITNNIIDLCNNGITFGSHSNIKISNNIIKVENFGIKPDQISDDSQIIINNNFITSDIGLDMRGIYNINCHQTITNNKIIATTTPLKKYVANINIGYITWNNPDILLDADNIANKYVNNSIIRYNDVNFATSPTGSSTSVGYYLGSAENGTVFIMSDGVWKRKTGGGGSTMVTTSDM